ncbi:hypothetical protein OE88DRAFT_1084388 [Heliocybe sulcata]|uniref:Uncharacterized protein n=1 Tax=Heliocybe sulcata TaxID=5364 RepID=A0A5C3MK83_9AGAM|nr:hypothetical protein OE88DRAFT_1084388 [Heliocybe sulcata]
MYCIELSILFIVGLIPPSNKTEHNNRIYGVGTHGDENDDVMTASSKMTRAPSKPQRPPLAPCLQRAPTRRLRNTIHAALLRVSILKLQAQGQQKEPLVLLSGLHLVQIPTVRGRRRGKSRSCFPGTCSPPPRI